MFSGVFSETASVPLFALDSNGICIAGAPDEITQNKVIIINLSSVPSNNHEVIM